jgi:hypothetical protein
MFLPALRVRFMIRLQFVSGTPQHPHSPVSLWHYKLYFSLLIFVRCFTTCQRLDCVTLMVARWINDELESIFEGNSRGIIEILSAHLPAVTGGNHEQPITFLLLVGWNFWYCGHYWPTVPAPGDR